LRSTNELFGLLGSRQIIFTRARWLLEMSTSSTSSPSSLSSLAHGSGFQKARTGRSLNSNIVYICITLVSTSTSSFLHEPSVHLLQDRANRLRPV
jgi:hypothetical protein